MAQFTDFTKRLLRLTFSALAVIAMGDFALPGRAAAPDRATSLGRAAVNAHPLSFSAGTSPSLGAALQAPLQPAGQLLATTDKKHQNEDYLMLKPGETRRMPLARGRLLRLWCTSLAPDKTEVILQNGPSVRLLRGGKALQGELYEKAYTFYPDNKTASSLRLLNAGAALVVTNHDKADNKFFYQAFVQPATDIGLAGLVFDGGTVFLGGQTVNIAAGANSAPLLMDAKGKSGVITEVRIRTQPTDLATLSKLFLRIDRLRITSRKGGIVSSAAEGKQSRALYVSVAALAGQFFDIKPVNNAMTVFDGKTLILRWPMPFNGNRDDLEISVENKGSQAVQVQVSATAQTSSAPPPYIFCAAQGSARTAKGKPLEILKAQDEGALLGLNFGVSPTTDSSRRTFTYLEGNETITTDSRKYEGTGTEDFFNSAWYFPKKAFSRPFHGVTYKGDMPPRVSAYRLLVPDAMTWKKNLHFQFESGRNNNADDLNYRWVVFWYQKAPLNYEIADALGDTSALTSAAGNGASGNPASGSSSGLVWAVIVIAFIAFTIWTMIRRRRH